MPLLSLKQQFIWFSQPQRRPLVSGLLLVALGAAAQAAVVAQSMRLYKE